MVISPHHPASHGNLLKSYHLHIGYLAFIYLHIFVIYGLYSFILDNCSGLWLPKKHQLNDCLRIIMRLFNFLNECLFYGIVRHIYLLIRLKLDFLFVCISKCLSWSRHGKHLEMPQKYIYTYTFSSLILDKACFLLLLTLGDFVIIHCLIH